jgi:copper transport protein
MMHRRLLLALVVLLTAILSTASGVQTAQAHGYIIRTLPGDRSTLERAPTRIQIWFSESLEPRFSTITLADERGNSIPLADAGVSPANPAQLVARIPDTLPEGAYVATIRAAFRSDAHVFTQTLIFWVGAQGAADVSALTQNRVTTALPLEVMWRVLLLPAFNVLFGVILLYNVVLIPGWGNPRYAAGNLPPRVMSRLNLIVWIALSVVAVSSVLALLQQSAVLFATDIPTVLRESLWSVVLNGTQVGDMFRLRAVLIGLIAAAHYGTLRFADRFPFMVRPLWTTNTLLAGAALGTVSATSHAAGVDLWQFGSMLVDWLHLLANSAWIGGLAALVFVLPTALAPLPSGERGQALSAVFRHFARLGVIAVSLLIATGVYSSLVHIRQPGDVPGTPYGLAWVGKLLLVAPLLGLAVVNSRLVNSNAITNLLRTTRVETGIGVVVLAIAALLSATPPPQPPMLRTELPTQTTTVSADSGEYGVSLSLDPGASGGNGYEVNISQNGQPIEQAQVVVQFAIPALDQRTRPLTLDEAGNGLYVGAGLELERPGEWHALINITPPDGERFRAAFRWQIPDYAPNSNVRDPSILNVFSALAVMGVIAAWVVPPMRRRVLAMAAAGKLPREIVIIGGAASIATVFMLTLVSVALADASRQADLRRNPPAQIVNPVLADAESLARGRAVIDTWNELVIEQLADWVDNPNTRDAEIFRTLTQGVGGMPELSDAAKWDVINYLRWEFGTP